MSYTKAEEARIRIMDRYRNLIAKEKELDAGFDIRRREYDRDKSEVNKKIIDAMNEAQELGVKFS